MSEWRKAAAQQRSRDTEEALAVAARELLSENGYEGTTVAEVARSAGTSVGGFYARFTGKRALLHLADIDFLEEARAAFDRRFTSDYESTLEGTLESFVRVMITEFDRHRGVILQCVRHTTDQDQGEFKARTTAFNNHVHGRMRELLARHASRITHSDIPRAINMALFMTSASGREAMLHGALEAYPLAITRDELVGELCRASLSYLTGEAT